MENGEIILQPLFHKIPFSDDHPFYAVTIGTYTIRNGIKTKIIWTFNRPLPNIEELNKIPLGTVHRQADSVFKEYPSSRIDLDSLNLSMFCTTFLYLNKTDHSYYCLCLYLNSSISKTPQFNDLIFNRLQAVSHTILFTIKNEGQLNSLTNKIRSLTYDCMNIIEAGIHKSLFIRLPPSNDHSFFSLALTSHIETMMTTIIEISEGIDHMPLFDFLAQFLLPYQAQLSQNDISNQPIPGLYLQVVQQHASFPLEIMMQFERPWTWIRMSKKQVFQSPDYTSQGIAYKDYRTNILLSPDIVNDNEEVRLRFTLLKKNYIITNPEISEWSSKIVKKLDSISPELRVLFIQQKLNELIRRSITLNNMMDHLLSSSNVNFLQGDQLTALGKALNIKGKDEMKIAVAIASIFDPKAYSRAYGGRREVFSRMIVML